MTPKAAGLAIALVLATLLVMGGPANAQATNRQQRISRSTSTDPAILSRCFVPNCVKCNNFNPYFCAQCATGYQLTAAFSCNSCAIGYEQNLEVQTFTCIACQPGFTSNGGVGEASQCYKITATTARRLFEADEDLWA